MGPKVAIIAGKGKHRAVNARQRRASGSTQSFLLLTLIVKQRK
jgi:hypothetical protein